MIASAKRQLVEITWQDAAHYKAWVSNIDDTPTVEVKTVGYVVRQNRRDIAVAQSWSEELKMWGGVWVIPKGWVTRVRRLKG